MKISEDFIELMKAYKIYRTGKIKNILFLYKKAFNDYSLCRLPFRIFRFSKNIITGRYEKIYKEIKGKLKL